MNHRVLVAISLLMLLAVSAHGAEHVYSFHRADGAQPGAAGEQTVVGVPLRHTVKQGETLLDIARAYGLGINELTDLYPDLDPWIPHPGLDLVIPCRWILPEIRPEGVVVNIPELRLYQFDAGSGLVRTYPIGIGDEGWHTPLGIFRVGSKREHPTWYIPPSLQEKYGAKTMAPGPDNPLGEYYMALNSTRYGIHGTNVPWSVGRLVTHGCIRLYPEDIRELFSRVTVGTPVRIIYAPVKLGMLGERVFVEVHGDIYGRVRSLERFATRRVVERGLAGKIDYSGLSSALGSRDGLPRDITR